MNKTLTGTTILSGIFAIILVVVGLLNLFLIHPVPGIAYMLLALLYLPQTNALLMQKWGFHIPGLLKIILGIVLIIFTLGVSDLGDMIDKM